MFTPEYQLLMNARAISNDLIVIELDLFDESMPAARCYGILRALNPRQAGSTPLLTDHGPSNGETINTACK